MSTGPAGAKAVWTDADFEAMNGHDAAVHAIAVEPAPPHPGRGTSGAQLRPVRLRRLT